MYRRTFEVLSKWVAKQNHVSIVFDTEGGAHADMEKDILHLPQEIANENALGAIALMMHEAAHIRHSKPAFEGKKPPIKDIAPMQSDFHIFNAMEDIRIDLKNFRLLPNIPAFYEELVRKHMDMTKDRNKRSDAVVRLCAGILYAEGFNPKLPKQDREWFGKNDLIGELNQGKEEIEDQNWGAVKKRIQKIKKMLGIDPKKDKPNMAMAINEDPNGDKGKGKGQLVDGTGQPDPNDLSGVGQILRPAAVWGQGKKMPGPSMVTNPIAMDEQCARQFKEILNVKEIKIIEEGSILDTDNLTAFFTGDIQELFKQEKTVRKKKSQVMFLIDASGSMGTKLLDNKTRAHVVKSCVQKLTAILDEVQQMEGLNVDWKVSQFDDVYKALTKENWQREYYADGGTSFINGFDGAINEMVKDYTIEGKRIIVAFSDGDISGDQIDYVNELIRKHGADVRAMVIGVGSDLQSKFVKDIVGDNVIIAEDNATEVIMESIKAML